MSLRHRERDLEEAPHWPCVRCQSSQRVGIVHSRVASSDLRIWTLRLPASGLSAELLERGLSIPETALISGHRDWKSLQRYVKLRPAHVSAALARTRTPNQAARKSGLRAVK